MSKIVLHPLTAAGKVDANAHGDKMSSFYATQAQGYDAVRENMLRARPGMMSAFGPIRKGHTWLDVGGGTGRNLHYLRAQLDLFERIIVLDICPELLEIGQANARQSFTQAQCDKIHWVCLDINAKNVRQVLAKHCSWNGGDLNNRGFDTISFSYSLSMIPQWEQAMVSAKSLLSVDGRVIVSDFDTYTEAGGSIKDWLIKSWYAQDGVRIEAKTRDFLCHQVFSPDQDFTATISRFQEKLMKVNIPHYVACFRKGSITSADGVRRASSSMMMIKNNLKHQPELQEEKKED